MITSKELMIGDWYAFRGHPHKCTARDIASIAECEEKGAPTDISEIPITTEILKRNGFILTEVGDNGISTPRKNINRYEKHECKTKWRDIIMWYDRITKKWCLHGINNIQLNYIHELQHALRLCRIEKEIKL